MPIQQALKPLSKAARRLLKIQGKMDVGASAPDASAHLDRIIADATTPEPDPRVGIGASGAGLSTEEIADQALRPIAPSNQTQQVPRFGDFNLDPGAENAKFHNVPTAHAQSEFTLGPAADAAQFRGPATASSGDLPTLSSDVSNLHRKSEIEDEMFWNPDEKMLREILRERTPFSSPEDISAVEKKIKASQSPLRQEYETAMSGGRAGTMDRRVVTDVLRRFRNEGIDSELADLIARFQAGQGAAKALQEKLYAKGIDPHGQRRHGKGDVALLAGEVKQPTPEKAAKAHIRKQEGEIQKEFSNALADNTRRQFDDDPLIEDPLRAEDPLDAPTVPEDISSLPDHLKAEIAEADQASYGNFAGGARPYTAHGKDAELKSLNLEQLRDTLADTSGTQDIRTNALAEFFSTLPEAERFSDHEIIQLAREMARRSGRLPEVANPSTGDKKIAPEGVHYNAGLHIPEAPEPFSASPLEKPGSDYEGLSREQFLTPPSSREWERSQMDRGRQGHQLQDTQLGSQWTPEGLSYHSDPNRGIDLSSLEGQAEAGERVAGRRMDEERIARLKASPPPTRYPMQEQAQVPLASPPEEDLFANLAVPHADSGTDDIGFSRLSSSLTQPSVGLKKTLQPDAPPRQEQKGLRESEKLYPVKTETLPLGDPAANTYEPQFQTSKGGATLSQKLPTENEADRLARKLNPNPEGDDFESLLSDPDPISQTAQLLDPEILEGFKNPDIRANAEYLQNWMDRINKVYDPGTGQARPSALSAQGKDYFYDENPYEALAAIAQTGGGRYLHAMMQANPQLEEMVRNFGFGPRGKDEFNRQAFSNELSSIPPELQGESPVFTKGSLNEEGQRMVEFLSRALTGMQSDPKVGRELMDSLPFRQGATSAESIQALQEAMRKSGLSEEKIANLGVAQPNINSANRTRDVQAQQRMRGEKPTDLSDMSSAEVTDQDMDSVFTKLESAGFPGSDISKLRNDWKTIKRNKTHGEWDIATEHKTTENTLTGMKTRSVKTQKEKEASQAREGRKKSRMDQSRSMQKARDSAKSQIRAGLDTSDSDQAELASMVDDFIDTTSDLSAAELKSLRTMSREQLRKYLSDKTEGVSAAKETLAGGKVPADFFKAPRAEARRDEALSDTVGGDLERELKVVAENPTKNGQAALKRIKDLSAKSPSPRRLASIVHQLDNALESGDAKKIKSVVTSAQKTVREVFNTTQRTVKSDDFFTRKIQAKLDKGDNRNYIPAVVETTEKTTPGGNKKVANPSKLNTGSFSNEELKSMVKDLAKENPGASQKELKKLLAQKLVTQLDSGFFDKYKKSG